MVQKGKPSCKYKRGDKNAHGKESQQHLIDKQGKMNFGINEILRILGKKRLLLFPNVFYISFIDNVFLSSS